VIQDAKAHGLVLGDNGKLYDSKKGEALPTGVAPMPLLTAEELARVDCPTSMQVVGGYVRRYLDMVALSNDGPVKVIGETGIIRDKPGFEIDFITRQNATETKHSHDRPSVLMPVKGHWRVDWDGGSATLAPGDTMSVPENLAHCAVPSMTGEAAMYHVVATDDPAGKTWTGNS
jgi:mannose-6-phosphate isomerase-like protein (cupin superfamily)